ncbi:MAG TPA: PKD domain-containing protein [Planctomycetota bacterium]|nr:PKD domain-containing protein [Planctomycetota bacterium]
MCHSMYWRRIFLVLCLVFTNAVFAETTAVINASPSTGQAPLGVSFDAGSSSADIVSYLWEFGDGSISTAKTITHVYTVAGTYTAKLTGTTATGATSSAEVSIVVTGSGQGPVSPDMNFRIALTQATFNLRHSQTDRDTFRLDAAFNTVDLPGDLQGLATTFSINGLFTVSGVLGENGRIESAENIKPSYFIEVNALEQTLRVDITRAELKAAFAASGATNTTVTGTGIATPVTLILTIGAQTYSLTENFSYTSQANGVGRGRYNLKQGLGTVEDGFFVISRASAVEEIRGESHFFEFDGYLSKPMSKILQTPGAGIFVFKFNDADREVILFDRVKQNGSKIIYEQTDRDLSGIRRFTIDTKTRLFNIKTWDLAQDERKGGTGLPIRGKPFTAFNFAIRIEFDQADGTKFEAVTATRLTRRTKDDAFWQTGRRGKRQ